MDIAIATCAAFPELGPYDRGVVDALRHIGLKAEPVVWTDPAARWRAAKLVVVQSTWDSHLLPDAFLDWADCVEEVAPLHNPARLMRWNLHKRYLRELEANGVPVTPTVWLNRGETIDLGGLMRDRGWYRAVVKPAVSASANETHVAELGDTSLVQSHIERLSATNDLMIQPYLDAFETEGERSFVFIDGKFSHAVHRPPTLQSAARRFDEPCAFLPESPDELRLAERAIAAVGERLLYARVDVATNNDGAVRLQEVELVEPCLFTALSPGAAERMAHAIAARI